MNTVEHYGKNTSRAGSLHSIIPFTEREHCFCFLLTRPAKNWLYNLVFIGFYTSQNCILAGNRFVFIFITSSHILSERSERLKYQIWNSKDLFQISASYHRQLRAFIRFIPVSVDFAVRISIVQTCRIHSYLPPNHAKLSRSTNARIIKDSFFAKSHLNPFHVHIAPVLKQVATTQIQKARQLWERYIES